VIDLFSSLSLGTLDATELGLVSCLCLLLVVLALNWRARQILEGQVQRLGRTVMELDRRQSELDPRELKTRDEGFVELLRSLLDYTRATRGSEEESSEDGTQPNEEEP
jgi:hypothetical protein